ncbi:MAG: YfhO family protein [Xanthobacteraceae bacterium]|nr:YfhO family protein [Xanthobacteraceae bacterium]
MAVHRSLGQRFPYAAAFGIYTAAFLAVASPWLLDFVRIPYDSVSQFYPSFAFLARSLATGQSPFWTPNVYAGWPQIADPQSLIFSPLYLIVALCNPNPSPRLFDVLTFGLLYAGGAGMMLFFRDRRWHAAAAVAAALAFSLGGSAASRIQHIGQVESLVFLPLALWMLARALDRSSWLAGAAAGLFASFIVIGRDQVSLIATYVLVGYVLWHWLDGTGRRKRLAASLKPLAAGAIVGACIVTVPVILTELLARSSNRPEISFAHAVHGSLHPASLLMLAFADVFGASDFSREFWGPPSIPWHDMIGDTGLYDSQNTGQIYTGALVAVALLGLAFGRGVLWTREIRFFTVAAAVALLYALGKYTPLYYVLYELLPGVALYRRPADATFVLCGLLAVVAGYLIHRLIEGTLPLRRWQLAVSAATVAALVAVSVVLARSAGMLASAALPLLWGAAFLAVAAGALALARRAAPRSAAMAALVLAAFSAADFAWNNAPNESTGLPSSMFGALRRDTNDETVVALKARLKDAGAPDRRDRVELIGIAYHWPNIGLIHDFDHLFGHNPLRLGHFEDATGVLDTVAAVRGPFTPLLPSYRSTLQDLFGVRFIVLGEPIETIDPALKPGDVNLVGRTRDAYIYENPRALPRVLMATQWQKADFAKLISDGVWPEFDPRRTVLLDQAPANAPSGGGGAGSARILRYENIDIEIEADAPSGGFVVLNDVWHPWWRASVDGKPAEMLKANVLFRGVAVPPGKHVVRFTFHPFAGAVAELRARFGPK